MAFTRPFVIVAAVVALSSSGPLRAQQAAPRLVLHFTSACDLSTLVVKTNLTGPFGQYGEGGLRVVPAAPGSPALEVVGPQDVSVPTITFKGDVAIAADLMVYCRGFRFVLVHAPELGDQTIDLTPLATVPMRGSIAFPAGIDPSILSIDVSLDATWVFERFLNPAMDRGYRGFIGLTPIATAPIQRDGSFGAMLPDFAHDPAVTGFSPSLAASLHPSPAGYRLRADRPDVLGFFGNVAASYPDELHFTLEPVPDRR